MQLLHFALGCRLVQLMTRRAVSAATNSFPMNNVIRLWEGLSLAAHAEKASSALLTGEVVALPTDTLYGIAALAQNDSAIHKIYQIKRRSCTKPLAICVAEVEEVYRWCQVTVCRSLLDALLPGPVTLIFQRTPELNSSLNPGTDLVGVRIPSESFIREVVRQSGSPLALTSANISSKASPLCIEEFEELWGNLGWVFDAGPLEQASREGSTIVDLSQPGGYRLVRRGIAYHQTTHTLQNHSLTLVD